MKKVLICAGELDAHLHEDGTLYLDAATLITPDARDEATRRGLRIVHGAAPSRNAASAGLYSAEVLGYALYGVPACILGTLCAFPVVKRIRAEVFRKVLMALIALSGVVCLWRARCF